MYDQRTLFHPLTVKKEPAHLCRPCHALQGTASIARSDEFRPAHTKPVALYCTSTISTQFAPFPTG